MLGKKNIEQLDAESRRKPKEKAAQEKLKREEERRRKAVQSSGANSLSLAYLGGAVLILILCPLVLLALVAVSVSHGMTATAIFFAAALAVYLWVTVRLVRRLYRKPAEGEPKTARYRVPLKVSFLLLALIPLLPLALGAYYYESTFGKHYETAEWLKREPGEFPGLEQRELRFPTADKTELAGYLYKAGNKPPKALVIISHAFGAGGFNANMDLANWFAQRGYAVFGYDATANDNSQGKGIPGLARGPVDLEHAISFCESLPELKGLPILLLGQSWGGYNACSVLASRPEIKAVCAASSFNSTDDLVIIQGYQMLGPLAPAFLPYFFFYEDMKNGLDKPPTAIQGFEASSAPVVIVQGADDTTVPPKYGYDLYLDKFKDNPRFTFLSEKGRGHNDVFYSNEAIAYREEANELLKKFVKEKDEKLSPELLTEFMHSQVDRQRYFQLDDSLLEKINQVFERAIQ